MFKPGQRVQINKTFFMVVDGNNTKPLSWKNDATLLKMELDTTLTEMCNKKRFRCIIEFDEEPWHPSKKDIQRFTEEYCYIASVLPRMLTAL